MHQFVYLMSFRSVVRVPLEIVADWYAEKFRCPLPEAFSSLQQLSARGGFIGRLRLFVAKGSIMGLDKNTAYSSTDTHMLEPMDYYILPTGVVHLTAQELEASASAA